MGAVASDLMAVYRLLSIQAHTLPMSFYRTIEQRRSTGVETYTEFHYNNTTVTYVIPYLQLATRQILGLFPDAKRQLSDQQLMLLDRDFVHFEKLS